MRDPDVIGNPFFGTEDIDGERALTPNERGGRCYELSAYAVVFGTAPEGSVLVHGSIHGPEAGMQRIGHAWIELPDGTVWEPLYHEIHRDWATYADAREERRYTRRAAMRKIARTGTWGAWHKPTYLTRDHESGVVS